MKSRADVEILQNAVNAQRKKERKEGRKEGRKTNNNSLFGSGS